MTAEREGCRCDGGPTGPEHRALVARVDRSFEQDRDRALLALQGRDVGGVACACGRRDERTSMSARVWKFTVPPPDEFGRSFVSMPAGARPLSVAIQKGDLVVWALVGEDFNPPGDELVRSLIVANTGMAIPGFPESAEFLGTAESPSGVIWHVWDAGLNEAEGGF